MPRSTVAACDSARATSTPSSGALPEVTDSLVVHLDGGDDEPMGQLLLFVVLADAARHASSEGGLDEALVSRLRRALASELSPRHVPDVVEAVPAIPRTLSGKKLELPVKRILTGADPDSVVSRDSLADPAALQYFVRRRPLASAGLRRVGQPRRTSAPPSGGSPPQCRLRGRARSSGRSPGRDPTNRASRRDGTVRTPPTAARAESQGRRRLPGRSAFGVDPDLDGHRRGTRRRVAHHVLQRLVQQRVVGIDGDGPVADGRQRAAVDAYAGDDFGDQQIEAQRREPRCELSRVDARQLQQLGDGGTGAGGRLIDLRERLDVRSGLRSRDSVCEADTLITAGGAQLVRSISDECWRAFAWRTGRNARPDTNQPAVPAHHRAQRVSRAPTAARPA